MKRPGTVLLAVLLLNAAASTAPAADCDDPACRSASWKGEFERICAQTEIATRLSEEQLRQLLSDSDALLGLLEREKAPGARVYIFRLRNCRNFFDYTLQVRESGEDASPSAGAERE